MADPRRGAATASAAASRRPSLPFLDGEEAAAGSPGRTGYGDMPVARAEAAVERLSRLRPQEVRRRWVMWSALLFVGLPALLSTIYFGLFAAPQYAVEVRFAVRGGSHVSGGTSGSDLLSSIAGVPGGGPTIGDAYIVMDFLKSRAIIEKMRPLVDVRSVYASPNADVLVRLDPAQGIEDVVEYWRGMIDVSFDMISQIIAVEVRAFSPEEAARVAEGVLTFSEELINSLSERARLDAVRFAEHEVKRTEDRLRTNRALVRTFRDEEQEIDPLKKADSQLSLTGQLEANLAGAKARLTTLRQYMGANAPSVNFAENQIKALERQLEQERGKLGRTGQSASGISTLSGQVAAYEELLVEREFAEKAYVSALSSLERARMDAAQQQRYLATFVRPSLPQEALYPKRFLNVFLITGGAFLLWALGVLVVYAIRDHAG